MFVYEAILQVENLLSFRTNEYGNVVRTGRILHNWALMFALNGVHGDPEKDHIQNLAGKPIYATPAIPMGAEFQFQTFHPFPEARYLLRAPEKLTAGAVVTYQNNNTILQYKEFIAPGSKFRFAVASTKELPEEMVITYGGKQTLQRVVLESADSFLIQENFHGNVRHPINPLDFKGRIVMVNAFQYSVPPTPLFEGSVTEPFKALVARKGHREYVLPPSW